MAHRAVQGLGRLQSPAEPAIGTTCGAWSDSHAPYGRDSLLYAFCAAVFRTDPYNYPYWASRFSFARMPSRLEPGTSAV
jgi:hypothetical protein